MWTANERKRNGMTSRPRQWWWLLAVLVIGTGLPSGAWANDEEGWEDAADWEGLRTPQPTEHLQTWHDAYPSSEQAKTWTELDGEWTIELGTTYYGVSGDEGRFRQDRFRDDEWTGGIEDLNYRSQNERLRIRAIGEDDFLVDGTFIRPDQFQMDLDFRKVRKYYDGSSNPLDPVTYMIPPNVADLDDDNLYADRVWFTLEGTLLMPDLPHIKVGWHRWERFGEEVLAAGGLARVDALPARLARQRAIPTVNSLDGASDTVYIEVPFTIADKYNVTIRQEFEKYLDDQVAEIHRFRNGAFEETLTHADDLEWEEFRTRIDVNSFLTDSVYASLSYYHSDLENDTDRTVTRPGPTPSGGRSFQFIETAVQTEQERDVLALGLVFLAVAPRTQINTSVRLERVDMNGEHNGLEDGFGGPAIPTPVRNASNREDVRVGEQIELVSKYLANTTLTLSGEWEQRSEETKETINSVFAYDADIDTTHQEYKARAVHRPRRDLKLTASYQFTDHEEDYDYNFDNTPGGYPGHLGDRDQRIHDVMAKADWHFLPAWTGTVQYQFESSENQFDRQGTDGQDLEVHRVSTTLFGAPIAKLACTAMIMYEDYLLDTPTVIPAAGNNWGVGASPYEFNYEAIVAMLSGQYKFNKKWSGNLSFQHTQTSGRDVNTSLEEVWLGADYRWSENKIVHCRYEYFGFDDDFGDGFDDYHGHGVSLTLAYRF